MILRGYIVVTAGGVPARGYSGGYSLRETIGEAAALASSLRSAYPDCRVAAVAVEVVREIAAGEVDHDDPVGQVGQVDPAGQAARVEVPA
jgi:hypothetical protein